MGSLGTFGTSFQGSSPTRVPGQERRGPPTPGEKLDRTLRMGLGTWGAKNLQLHEKGLKVKCLFVVESALRLSS